MLTYTCGYCGRPAATFVWLNGRAFHEECTHGPDWQRLSYAPNPIPLAVGAMPMHFINEDRVREIVREEIEALKDKIEHALGARP